eukprot:6141925-Pyramimonas_sp.AAC.1
MLDDATGTAEEAEATFPNNSRGTAMLGSSEFWRNCSHRSHAQAESIGESLVYLARHCAECAPSSGGWVCVGDLIQKMKDDGISHATVSYAMHAFAMLPSGEIDVL